MADLPDLLSSEETKPSLQVKAEEKTVKPESASANRGGGKSSTDERDITDELFRSGIVRSVSLVYASHFVVLSFLSRNTSFISSSFLPLDMNMDWTN